MRWLEARKRDAKMHICFMFRILDLAPARPLHFRFAKAGE